MIRLSDELSMDIEETSQLPPTHDTFYISPSELMLVNLTDSSMVYISWETVEYVMKVISKQMPNIICPLRVPGDGNCLLHAVSHALWGRVSYHEALRQLLKQELAEHEEFYRHSVDKLKEDEESQGYTKEEFEKFVGDASSTHAFLEFIHIFAISNVLKRPIVVYAGDDDLKAWGVHEEGCAGTFLPTRHGAQECCGPPITLGWSNGVKNHFVPFCPVEGSKPEWPALDVVFKKTLRNGETAEDYFRYGNLIISNMKKKREKAKQKLVEVINKLRQEEFEETEELLLGMERGYSQLQTKAISELKKKLIQRGLISPPPPETIQPMTYIKEPKTTCNYIPFTDPYIFISSSNNNYKNMLDKIIQFNKELNNTKPEQQLTLLRAFRCSSKVGVLGPFQIRLLENLFKVLVVNSRDFCSAVFDHPALDLVAVLLSWPLDMLWPVIDLVRVLILHQSAAEYYVKASSKIDSNIFTILLNMIRLENISFNNRQLAIKFSLNLFKQPCNHPFLLMYSKAILTVLVKCIKELNHTPDQNIKIILVITQIFINYVSMWWKEGPAAYANDHTDSIETLLNWCIEVLQDPQSQQNSELIYNVMVTVGTLLRGVGKTNQLVDHLRPFLERTALLPELLEPFRNFPEPKIRECAIHILESIELKGV